MVKMHKVTLGEASSILLVAGILLTACAGDPCEFEGCLYIYNNLKAVFEETGKGDVLALCPYQLELKECMKKQNRRCRGDLNYHFFEKLVRDLVGSTGVGKNCSKANLNAGNGSGENGLRGNHGSSREGHSTPPHFLNPPVVDKCAGNDSLRNGPDSSFVTCSIFGLTNLKPFSEILNETDVSYCSLSGAWSLIDTPEYAVQITNKGGLTPLPKDITATTLVTVIIKSNPCSERKTYQATFDEVPAMFSDGSLSAGSVQIESVKDGERIRIHFPFISTTLDIIKIIDRLPLPSLSVTIRKPLEVAKTLISDPGQLRGLPLCFYGCPTTAKIRRSTSSNPETPLRCTATSPMHVDVGGTPLQVVPDQDDFDISSSGEVNPLKSAVCASLDVIQPLIEGTTVINRLHYPGDSAMEKGTRWQGREGLRAENSALTSSQSAGILRVSGLVLTVVAFLRFMH